MTQIFETIEVFVILYFFIFSSLIVSKHLCFSERFMIFPISAELNKMISLN